ncbi:MAG: tRNA dihydrouridine(20/20a) synthase DusA [Leptospiraceae bacterium]|nr:tRNA dihydrouridine(20/20a) synthase DusA [Leptospiraceae bacterium]MDW7976606.1 tRNA dihydrouridine(20/20a) synthase DusA [Leptospiraceae bacterium]
MNPKERKVSIAPMMDWTDRHFRYFIRLISKYVVLYTEMIPENSLVFNEHHPKKLKEILDFHPREKPLIFQIGGSRIEFIKRWIELIEKWGYDGININAGCPSSKVQNANFGVILMNDPHKVGKMIKEIQRHTNLPVSIKHRLGFRSNQIDKTQYEDLKNFIETTSQYGCRHYIIHARFAFLENYSPKQNRSIPPLMYDWVYRVKSEFPKLHIEINGGISSIQEIQRHLEHVDSVMIGRAAYENPYFLKDIDFLFLKEGSQKSKIEIFRSFYSYVIEQLEEGIYPHQVIKHTFGLFYGEKNAKRWKTLLWDNLLMLKKKPIHQIQKQEVIEILENSLSIFFKSNEIPYTKK